MQSCNPFERESVRCEGNDHVICICQMEELQVVEALLVCWGMTRVQDDMARNEDPNQYVVMDPLLEKGKEKFNKQQAKVKKRNREWAGKSLD